MDMCHFLPLLLIFVLTYMHINACAYTHFILYIYTQAWRADIMPCTQSIQIQSLATNFVLSTYQESSLIQRRD